MRSFRIGKGASALRHLFKWVVLISVSAALAACSASEPGGESTMSVLPNAQLDALAKTSSPRARACKRMERWYEGFFKKHQVHEGAVNELKNAILTEKARLERRGFTTFAIRDRKTTCKPTYPLGFKEWKCFASAKVCAGGKQTAKR